jgi:hypothetical protein
MEHFAGAHSKIERANDHIAQLDSEVSLLQQSDVAFIEIQPEAGYEVIKHDLLSDKEALRKIALISGDVFHNLKCALDYAWIETITKLAPYALSKFAKFPVYPTGVALEAALRGNGIDKAAGGRLFETILTKIKPYSTGDYAIWPIHRLNIRDKHRLLIPVVLYASVSGIETEENAIISRDGFTAGTHQEPPWYIHMRPGVHVRNTGKVSIGISFEYGNAGYESIFADTLHMYSQSILGVVKVLEALV